ncbi:MAG TPA: GNAT family N-acetyltransferase [Ktedonobacterales bacterium]|nr:GNAT family N-acetyltransferase [Ktedonobacterales bacterium]
MELRTLTPADAATYWALRLRALREVPYAFGSSYEDSKDRPLGEVAKRLASEGDDFTLGAFDGETLVGMVTFHRQTGTKERHTANVFGMYVAGEAQGRGIGGALLDALLARARELPGLEQIYLGVATTQDGARALYRSRGFEPYALVRRELKVGETYVDVEGMVLWLNGAPE